MIRCLIADDEPPAREALRSVLGTIPDVTVAGEAANGIEALELAGSLQPDLVFLDIEMPGMKGIEVAANLAAPIRVIFVTAFDEYAVQAFEASAMDYVLKPYRADRIARALDRVRASLEREQAVARLSMRKLLREAQQPLSRLAARKGKRIILLDLPAISHIGVEDKLAFAHTAEGRFLSDRTLTDLEELLADSGFFRISRAELVNLSHVAELIPWFSGTSKIRLKSGEELEVSRERTRELKDQFGI